MRLHLWKSPGPAGFGLALMLCAPLIACGEDKSAKSHDPSEGAVERSHPDRLPQRPSVPPAVAIPVDPLGFSAPGAIYLGQRFSHVSLDFLDEEHLLFTFRVPGLIHRQPQRNGEDESEERHIKAVVLELPSGAVQAEAVWTVHDHFRYLWMLKDGQFLVRDRDDLRLGDASLELKPFLHFPGHVLQVATDPATDLLVTNSREPVTKAPDGSDTPGGRAAADVAPDRDPGKAPEAVPEMVVRILRRDSGKVILVSRVRSVVHLPINSAGYLELLPGRGDGWVVTLNSFSGGTSKLGEVDSTCTPAYDFVSEREFVVTTCTRQDVRSLVAMETDGRHLWEDVPSSSPVWPVLVHGADGSRLARESLAVNHPVNAYSPISFDDVRGQVVEVFDTATGKIALDAPASPILDAGGNVAISPSGRQVAILNAGAIQVFDLPLPGSVAPDSARAQAGKPGQ